MNNTEKRTNNKKGIKIILAVVFIIAILSFFTLKTDSVDYITSFFKLELNQQESGYEDQVNKITEIDYTERQEALNEIVEEGMINICYSTSAVFEGKISKSFNVQNSINNHHPMVFEITDETGDVIYKSKKIIPGYELNQIELSKELSKGSHDCKIKIGYADEGNISSVFPIIIEVR